jgi:hypothetical protein
MLNIAHLVDRKGFIIINDPYFASICKINNLAVFNIDDILDR